MSRPGPDQIKAIETIVNGTPLIGGKMCEDGKRCVMGALLNVVGCPDEDLQLFDDADSITREYGARLHSLFHIDVHDANTLISANDDIGTIEIDASEGLYYEEAIIAKRRENILEALAIIAHDPRNRPSWG